MNEATSPADDPGTGGSPSTGTSDREDRTGQPGRQPDAIARFFAWVRGTGIIRGDDRWFAGVAGGIAAKAGIDPIIVRGVFVVLAVLGGPGILLYLAAWLLLPDLSGRIHAEEVVRGRSSTGVVIAVVLIAALVFIPVLFGLLPGLFVGSWGWSAWGVMPDWVQLMLGVLWWAVIFPGLIVWLIVWLSRRGSSADGSAPRGFGTAPDGGTGGSGSTQDQRFAERTAEWERRTEQQAHEWARKAEQQAQDWEQRSHERQERHSLGAGYITVTLALALLIGAAAALIALGAGGEAGLVATVALLTATATLALSMIVAGVRGRDSGWVGFFAFCGVIALLFAPFSTMLPEQTQVVPFGSATIQSGDTASDRALLMIGGNATVDLSELPRTAEPRTVEVWLLGGNSTVIMPDSAPVEVRIDVLAGNVRDLRAAGEQRRQGGIFMARSLAQHTEGVADDEITNVRIRMLGGNAYIEDSSGYRSGAAEAEDRDRLDEISRLEERIEELEHAR